MMEKLDLKLKADVKLLTQLMKRDNDSIVPFITDLLTLAGINYTIDEHDNILASRGMVKGSPLLIAHHDTVLDSPAPYLTIAGDYIVGIDYNGRQTGIGADDRAGCAAIFQLIDHLPNVSVMFCAQEEYGCVGSSQVQFKQFNNASLALQLDRRWSGISGDACYYSNGVQMASKVFRKDTRDIIKRYGYKFETGICTDIGELKGRGLLPSGLNLSVGYDREHMQSECLSLYLYERSINLALSLCKFCQGKQYPFNSPKIKTTQWRNGNWYNTRDYRSRWYGDDKHTSKSTPYNAAANHAISTTARDLLDVYDNCDLCGVATWLTEKDGAYLCKECMKDVGNRIA